MSQERTPEQSCSEPNMYLLAREKQDRIERAMDEASAERMSARVTTYGGEAAPSGIRTVQHWQLEVDGRFIADTSSPTTADLFRRIAERCSS